MSASSLTDEQQVIYYHVICYSKIEAIMKSLISVTVTSFDIENNALPKVKAAYDKIRQSCKNATDRFGQLINDPEVIKAAKTSCSPANLSELGIVGYEHAVDFATALLAFLRCHRNTLPQESEIKKMLADVLHGIERTLRDP